MEEKVINKQEAKKKAPKNSDEESLSHCTTAASAEHARAYDDDEPCDDGRTGKLNRKHSEDETTTDSG